MEIAVIGSGLSGISAARALAARGLSVTILDVGEQLEASRSAVVAKLRELPPNRWPPEDLQFIDENPTIGRHALPKKVDFGSEYIYARDRDFAPIVSGPGSRLPYPTFAKGGYSNIWGAATLAPDACDMADWPVSRSEMDPYFRSAAALMPLTGGEGTLEVAFPRNKERVGELEPGPQGRELLADLTRAAPKLTERQLLYGRARLAVYTEGAEGALPCINCGHCFTGCVYGSIFSTVPLLNELVRQGRAAYRSGVFVEKIREEGDRVIVDAVDVDSARRQQLTFDAAFLAAGPLNTTRLLLRSREIYDRPLLLKESQKFVVPMLRLKAAETSIEHPSVTLASLFIEAKVQALSDHWLHIQVISMNELMIKGTPLPGLNHPLGRRTLNPVLRRTMAAWCGMHSDHSAAVELKLRPPGDEGQTVLEIRARLSETAKQAAQTAAKHLFRIGPTFKTLFLYPMIKFSEPGSGTHCGASFPMAKNPKSLFETDVLGRPFGWSRVYAVDASILPSIPGTTLALPVMANAFRIASLAPLAEHFSSSKESAS